MMMFLKEIHQASEVNLYFMFSKHSQLKKSLSDTDSFEKNEKKNGQIPFLDTVTTRREDRNYCFTRKPHTHRPVPVVSIASSSSAQTCCHMDTVGKNDSIVTEEEDGKQEEEHTRKALHALGYPDWAVKSIKKQMNRKKAIRKDKSKKDKINTRKIKRSGDFLICPLIHGENTTYIH